MTKETSTKTIVEDLSEQGGALLFLLPEEIIVDEDILKARPLYDMEQEQAEIESLAAGMVGKDGQIEPVVVRPAVNGEEGGWHLVAGRRRRDAGMFINAAKSAKEEPFRLAAVVRQGLSKDDAFHIALSENLKRKNLNAIQLAMIIKDLRERNNWQGGKGTKKVAEYLDVSPATVTQAEKLLTLPGDMQKKVMSGEWSAQTAFEMLNQQPEKRVEVEQSARELQEQEEGEIEEVLVDPETGEEAPMPKKTGKNKASNPLKAKHVRTASRQHQSALQTKSLNRSEILQFFVKAQSPEYGFRNGVIHLFARTFLLWAEGKCKDETLKKYFDQLVEKADHGKESKEEVKESRARTAQAEKERLATKDQKKKASKRAKAKSKK